MNQKTVTLNTGAKMPVIGLGTCKLFNFKNNQMIIYGNDFNYKKIIMKLKKKKKHSLYIIDLCEPMPGKVTAAVKKAITVGYRHIDAALYCKYFSINLI